MSKPQERRTVLPFLTIQQKIPLLICILLVFVIGSFSWISYVAMKQAALQAGRQRLTLLTGQLSTMFQQQQHATISSTRALAADENLKKYINSDGKEKRPEAMAVLEKVRRDTTVVLALLLNASKSTILSSERENIKFDESIEPYIKAASQGPDYAVIGKFIEKNHFIYCPVVTAVTEGSIPIGFIIRWQKIYATPQSLEAFAQLIGTKANIYFGNSDGSLWIDLEKAVGAPPIEHSGPKSVYEYSRSPRQQPVFAAIRPIQGTPWQLLLEFDRSALLEGPNKFLTWVLIIGLSLIVIGIVAAWLIGRNFSRPLNNLTKAAALMASGDYSASVAVGRRDELGKLARAFNSMAIQVKNSQQDLEKKVQDRTARLEAVNNELEAFSYSVSHDLRAPLRAVSGYSVILKEDYGPQLDAEATRMLSAIVNNAKKMGQLIDDLITFSRLGRKEMSLQPIDMKRLAESSFQELMEIEKEKNYQLTIDPMPACKGDQSMIKQVWLNLISNAIKYSSKSPQPQIEVGCSENNGKQVYFVRDNGVGFDMQYSHKLFGVFQRLHNEEAFEGTGIGLALVKRIISKHAGEVWADSSPGNGATFYFSLSKMNGHELQ